MYEKNIGKIEKDKNEAKEYILEIADRCVQMGGNDSEIPALFNLTESLDNNEITPEEAKKRAQVIIDNKQDYH